MPFADRLKRATTVSPFVLVKLTKNRPLVGKSGASAMPSRPRSPPPTVTRSQVEEVFGDDAIADDADAAALLDGVEDRRIGGIGDEGDRRLQAGGEDGGAKRRPALKTAGRKGHECDEHGNELHRQSAGRVAGLRYHSGNGPMAAGFPARALYGGGGRLR